MTELRLVPIVGDDGDIDERETCLNVWIFRADRSSTKTARIVEQEFGLVIKANTITQWAKRGDWDERARVLLHDSAPMFYQRAASRLVGGSIAASSYLADVAEGNPAALLEDGTVDRGRVTAATALLDRCGFLPNTRKEAERNGTPVSRSASNTDDPWVGLDEEELRQAIAARVRHMG